MESRPKLPTVVVGFLTRVMGPLYHVHPDSLKRFWQLEHGSTSNLPHLCQIAEVARVAGYPLVGQPPEHFVVTRRTGYQRRGMLSVVKDYNVFSPHSDDYPIKEEETIPALWLPHVA